MSGYLLAPGAIDDLREIHIGIAEYSLDAADRILDELHRKFSALAGSPRIGRIRADLAPDVRMFPCGNYVILYLPADPVVVLQIVHQARNLPAVFRPPPE